MKVFTTEQLIASVRRRASLTIDIGSEGKEDSDLIDVLDEVLMDEIYPQIIKFQEDYFVRTFTEPVSSSTAKYRFPTRAVGNKLRDLFWERGEQREFIPYLTRELLPFYGQGVVEVPDGYYVEGDGIILQPPARAGTLLISYYFRPGQLVKADEYRQVLTVDSTTSVTLDSTMPTTWIAGTTLFDAHSSASGAENRVFDVGASVASPGAVLTFLTAIDGSVDSTFALQVGDYVVEAENAAVPSIPRDAHPVLAQAAAVRLLESDGDSANLKLARGTLLRMLDNIGHLFETRVDGKNHKIVNRRSFLTSQSRRKGGW